MYLSFRMSPNKQIAVNIRIIMLNGSEFNENAEFFPFVLNDLFVHNNCIDDYHALKSKQRT